MPVPIFDHPVIKEEIKEGPPKKEKLSAWSIFFSILLIAVFVIIGELAFRDLNRYFNPLYDSCKELKEVTFQVVNECDAMRYELNRLFLHADFVVPLLILGFIIYLLTRRKNLKSYLRVLKFSYYVFIAWISVHLIAEGEYFLMKHYKTIGIYAVLFTLAILLIVLIIYIQRKINKRLKEKEKK